MGEKTRISWTHHTFNPWWGCEKPLVTIGGKQVVSPECVRCYAETWDKARGGPTGPHWGHTAPRRFFGDKHWDEPRKWHRQAMKARERRRVFCLSMGDILEDRRDLDAHRARLWPLIRETYWLDWMLLTKRPENFIRLVPKSVWECRNVWPGVTAGTQGTANLRLPFLAALKTLYPHLTTWVSAEPLLEHVDFDRNAANPWDGWLTPCSYYCDHNEYGGGHRPRRSLIDLIIVGGESGHGARPMHPAWARSVRDQCQAVGVSFFFKQWGAWTPFSRTDGIHELPFGQYDPASRFGFIQTKPKDDAALLDGQEWRQMPSGAVL